MNFLCKKSRVAYLLFGFSYLLLPSGLQAASLKCGGIYKVQSGDSLGVIASRAYGRSSQYSLIYSANSDALKNGPSSIRVGQKLKIPCGQETAGSNKQQDDTKTQDSSEALFFAARGAELRQVVKLVRQGANVNFKNRARETPMHAAASVGRVDILHYLLRRGASHHFPTKNRWLPLHHAVRFGHIQAAQYLISIGSPINAKTHDNVTVFDIAYATRNREMVRMLDRYRR